jgi:hypothetical protein
MTNLPGLRLALLCCVVAAGALALSPSEAKACSVSQFDLAARGDLPRYTLVLFHKPGTPDSDASVKVLEELEKTWKLKANIDFEAIDASTPRGAKIARYWQVKEFPLAYLIAPTGWALASLPGKLDPAKIEPLMTSPGKVALRNALTKKKAVFLVLGNEKLKGFQDAVKAAKEVTKSVKENMKVEAGTLVVDPTDAREANLLRNLGLEDGVKETEVIVTYGKGRAVLQEVRAENLRDRLAFTVQLLGTADQCSLGQEIAGEPLLLGQSEAKPEPK